MRKEHEAFPYQGEARAERVDWKRGQGAVGEYLAWLVFGTIHGMIPIR
jgi:hypothetical protein